MFQYFSALEEQQALNADNDADLFCLHYIYIPRVNASLDRFKLTWNNHPLPTEGNKSPLQLYTAGSVGSSKMNLLMRIHMDLILRLLCLIVMTMLL